MADYCMVLKTRETCSETDESAGGTEIANLSAQWRLRYVKPRRRARHVLFFGDGDEVAQMAEFHSHPAYPLGMVSQATKYFHPTRSEDMLHR